MQARETNETVGHVDPREREVEAVLFDAMGTLVELAPPAPALARELKRRLGVRVRPERAEAAIAAEIAYYRAHLDEGRDEPALAALRTRCARVVAEHLSLPGLDLAELTGVLMASLRFSLYPDALPVLRSLRGHGLRLAVVSNWDVSLLAVLERLGVSSLVDAVAVSAVVGTRKPAPEIFRQALRDLGVAADRAIHVGDGLEEDVGGARAAGLHPVWLRRPEAKRESVRVPPEVTTIESLSELTCLSAGVRV